MADPIIPFAPLACNPIIYHGTPITPRAEMISVGLDRSLCVSYHHRRDAPYAEFIARRLMYDNGAFSFWQEALAAGTGGATIIRRHKRTPGAAGACTPIDWRGGTVIDPAEFLRLQRTIVETLTGHEAHRAFDILCSQTLRAHGYDPGLFEASVEQWHEAAKPYPYQAYGERNSLAKLNPEQVREIRRSTEPLGVLAEQFGVSKQTVSYVRLRRTWKHVPS